MIDDIIKAVGKIDWEPLLKKHRGEAEELGKDLLRVGDEGTHQLLDAEPIAEGTHHAAIAEARYRANRAERAADEIEADRAVVLGVRAFAGRVAAEAAPLLGRAILTAARKSVGI